VGITRLDSAPPEGVGSGSRATALQECADNVSFHLSTAEHVHPSGLTEEFTGRGPWRLGVLSNPLSGGNRRRGLNAIRRCLQHYPDIPHREVRTATDVQAALEDFAGRDLNLIGVNSGDGTVQAVLTVLLGQRLFPSLPLLALLSGGTTNMTHQDLGLSGSPAEALRRLLNWAHHGEGEALIWRRTILKVQTSSCTPPIYGLFFGSACIFNGIQFFHSWVHRMGLSGDPAHLLIMARFLWALARRDDALVAPVPAGIHTDRLGVAPRDYLLLLITTLDRLILGLRPFWQPGEGPLRLTAVSARPRHLLRVLPVLIRGRSNAYAQPGNGYISCSAREIRLDMTGGFAVDGELFRADARRGPILIQDGGRADFVKL